MESKSSDDMGNSKEKITTDGSDEENLDHKENKGTDDDAVAEMDARNSDSDDVHTQKSYPVILEAKPQHYGPAILNLAEEGKIKEEDATNTSHLDDGDIPVSGVMLPTGTTDGSTTIVQYAVTPKIEGERIQVKPMKIKKWSASGGCIQLLWYCIHKHLLAYGHIFL